MKVKAKHMVEFIMSIVKSEARIYGSLIPVEYIDTSHTVSDEENNAIKLSTLRMILEDIFYEEE